MIKPYYEEPSIKLYQEDCLNVMKEMPDKSVDLIVTDSPYGYSFMGKDWDKAVVRVGIWKECLRVLKSGAFAFVMSAPRQDVLSKMISNLQEVGFDTSFTSIYWAYASGFPKASNIGKVVDKRLGTYKEGKPTKNARFSVRDTEKGSYSHSKITREFDAQSSQAKSLNGSYGGFQPKPAVEIIIVAMKPLSEKTYVDQALKNKKGISWLNDCRIPIDPIIDASQIRTMKRNQKTNENGWGMNNNNADNPEVVKQSGRFPANLLVSDDVLNDGKGRKSGDYKGEGSKSGGIWNKSTGKPAGKEYGDFGSFSRYFNLDKWFEKKIKDLPENMRKIFPFLIVPKASKSEKNKGCEKMDIPEYRWNKAGVCQQIKGQKGNYHPTVKPIKLMSYLVTLGSRKDDIVLDPFVGSGTTLISCKLLNRKGIGIDNKQEYCDIAVARLKATMENLL